MDLTLKRQCPLCNEKFDLTEYAFHIQEEQLKQLRVIAITLNDIKDITELTYAYMEEENIEEDKTDDRNKNTTDIDINVDAGDNINKVIIEELINE
jgi:hypothetical protein